MLEKIKNAKSNEQFRQLIKEITAKNITDYAIIMELENKICETGNLFLIYTLLTNIKSCNSNRLIEIILDSNDSYYIYNTALNIKNIDIEKFSKRISLLENEIYIYCFAKEVPGANIEVLEKGILKTDDASILFSFAKNIDKCDKLSIFKRICELKNYFFMEDFLKEVDLTPELFDKLKIMYTETICNSNDTSLIYNSLINDNYVDKEKLELALLKTKNIYYIVKYLVFFNKINVIKDLFGDINNLRRFILLNPEQFNAVEYTKLLQKINTITISSEKEDFNYTIDNYLEKKRKKNNIE